MSIFKQHTCAIHYQWHQAATDRPPIVLLHGLGASSAQFASIAENRPADQSILMIDLPGHAENFITESTDLSFASFAATIIELCDHLWIKGAVFSGISMGGALSLRIAADRPDLVQNLLVVRPAWFADTHPENLAIIDELGCALQEGGQDGARSYLEADPRYQEMLANTPLAAQSLRAAIERPHAVAHAPVLCAMVHDAPLGSLAKMKSITCPAVVVASHADDLHPVALAQMTANVLPNGRLTILPPRYLEAKAHGAALTSLIFQRSEGTLT